MKEQNYRYLGKGIYSVAEAARLSRVSPATINRWLKGYTRKSGNKVVVTESLWDPELPLIDGQLSLGFLDLIEVRFISAFRKYGVSWNTIRLAANHAKELFSSDHPFSTNAFKTDGRSIFADMLEESGEKSLLDLVKNQYGFRQIISPSLYKGLEFDDLGDLLRWWPLGERKTVVIDPARAFGQPIVDKEGVPTSILAKAFKIEDSVSAVSNWYEVSPRSVKVAIEFEKKLAA